MQVHVNDVLEHSLEIHVTGLPLLFCMQSKFNALDNSLALIKLCQLTPQRMR